MRDTFFLYRDAGVHPRGYRQLRERVRSLYGGAPVDIQQIDSKTIQQGGWEQKALCLAVGGGADVPYHEKLRGEGNARIRAYVENGGHYLGICAGGYYGTAYIEFDRKGPMEVLAARELAFFPDTAVGPAFPEPRYNPETEHGSRVVKLSWHGPEAYPDCYVYFHGGCFFRDAEKVANVEILARYLELPRAPAAIIRCQVGEGIATLSGVHPEYAPAAITQQSPHSQQLRSLMKQHEAMREKLFASLLSHSHHSL